MDSHHSHSATNLSPARMLALLVLLVSCEEARGHIVKYTPLPSPTGQAGEDGMPDPEDAGDMSAGSGGSGGEPMLPMGGAGQSSGGSDAGPPLAAECVPLPPKPWVASGHPSSISGMEGDSLYNPPPQAVNDDLLTRWSTGVGQGGGEWLEVDFGSSVTLTRIELDHARTRTDTTANEDFPMALLVRMSDTARNFSAPEVAQGVGTIGYTSVVFPAPASGRYLMIQQTGIKPGNWWTIHELYAFCDTAPP